MKYKKIPEIVDAIEWTGNNLREVIDLIGQHPSVQDWDWKEYEALVKEFGLMIFLPTGKNVYACIGDMIIKDSHGYPHVCDLEKFNRMYIAVLENKDD